MTAPTLRERIIEYLNYDCPRDEPGVCSHRQHSLLREALAEMERLERMVPKEPGPFDNNWDLLP